MENQQKTTFIAFLVGSRGGVRLQQLLTDVSGGVAGEEEIRRKKKKEEERRREEERKRGKLREGRPLQTKWKTNKINNLYCLLGRLKGGSTSAAAFDGCLRWSGRRRRNKKK